MMRSAKKKTAVASLDDDDDNYLSRQTISRRENRKLMDGITSTLYRLEMESIKPSFDILLTSGVHRGLYLGRRRRALAAKRAKDNEVKLDSDARQPHRLGLPADSLLTKHLIEPMKRHEGPQRTEVIDEWQIPTSRGRSRGVHRAEFKPELKDDLSSMKFATLPRHWKPRASSVHKELIGSSSDKRRPRRDASLDGRIDYRILTLDDLPWREMRASPRYSYTVDETPVQSVSHTPRFLQLASDVHSYNKPKSSTLPTQKYTDVQLSADKPASRSDKASHFGFLTLNDLPWREMRADPEHYYLSEVQHETPVHYVSKTSTNPSGHHHTTIDRSSSRNVFEEDELMSYLPKPAPHEAFTLHSATGHVSQTPKATIPENIEYRDYGHLQKLLDNTFSRRHQYHSVDNPVLWHP